jgi:type II secretory pathway pseudopilin PulG
MQPPQAAAQGSSKSIIAIVLIVVGVGMLAVIGLLAAIAIPNFLSAKNKSQYSMCLQSLSNVHVGIESYLSENGSLKGLGPQADEACNNIMPGHDTAATCKGMVVKRVDTACQPGTFKVAYPSEFTYEVTAKAKDKASCQICITETGATPQTYTECRNPPGCRH